MIPHRRTFFAEVTTAQQLAVAPPVEGRLLPMLSGYAIVWNTLSVDRGGYKVRLLPNSARFTPQVHGLWHHEFRDVLGDLETGTLRIFPDPYGVKVEIDLPNTNAGRDVAELVSTRRVKGMSFAMVDDPKFTTTREDGVEIHDVTDFLCDEVTITAIPAFVLATIGVGSVDSTPRPQIGYAARTAQSLQFQRLRFDSPLLRLPEAAAV